MFDQRLKILLIFGSFSAVARGKDEYSSTSPSISTVAGNYNGKLSCPYFLFEPASHECYAGDPDCDWKNDPNADQTWLMFVYADPKALHSIFDGSSPRGNSSIRAISPIFRRDDNYVCVTNSYKVHSESKSGLLGLRVYQKPVHIALTDLIAYSDEAKKEYILFEVWGDQGDSIHFKEFPLKHFDSNFQIILEGIFGELPVFMETWYLELKQRTECTDYTLYTIPRQTTSTTLSKTTTMSSTTTEQPMGENGETITNEVMTSDRWVDSPPSSPLSNLWSTITWPTTSPPATQTLQEGNGNTITDKVMTTKWPKALPTNKQPTTTQTLLEGNGDTITDKATKSDTRVDARSLPEGNGCDSRNTPIILFLKAPGNSLIDFRVRPPCSASAASGALTD